MRCTPNLQGYCTRCGKLLPFPGFPASCGRPRPHGIGSHLKVMLRRVGIKSLEMCDCSKHAREINKWTADEAQARIDKIIDMMRSEAQKRGIVFVDSFARLIVRRAIANHRAECVSMNARREAQRAKAET